MATGFNLVLLLMLVGTAAIAQTNVRGCMPLDKCEFFGISKILLD
jgi:hypothetical protein